MYQRYLRTNKELNTRYFSYCIMVYFLEEVGNRLGYTDNIGLILYKNGLLFDSLSTVG